MHFYFCEMLRWTLFLPQVAVIRSKNKKTAKRVQQEAENGEIGSRKQNLKQEVEVIGTQDDTRCRRSRKTSGAAGKKPIVWVETGLAKSHTLIDWTMHNSMCFLLQNQRDEVSDPDCPANKITTRDQE